jgi:hypothetical protein
LAEAEGPHVCQVGIRERLADRQSAPSQHTRLQRVAGQPHRVAHHGEGPGKCLLITDLLSQVRSRAEVLEPVFDLSERI